MGQTVGLVVMAKDEAAHLPRMFASVESLIDAFTLVDVGSDDNTVEVARGLGATVHRLPWVDFLETPTRTLQLAKGSADYLLILSANDLVEQSEPLPALTAPQYMLRHRRHGATFRMPALVDGRADWHYEGPPVHSYLAPVLAEQREPLDALTVIQLDDDGRRAEKHRRYLAELEKHLEANPDDPRTVFYLGQTLKVLGRYEEAAAMLERRIALGGWEEEVWYAQYQKGQCEVAAGRWYDGRMTLLAAYFRRPTRAEPLRMIAMSMLPPADDLINVELDAYYLPERDEPKAPA